MFLLSKFKNSSTTNSELDVIQSIQNNNNIELNKFNNTNTLEELFNNIINNSSKRIKINKNFKDYNKTNNNYNNNNYKSNTNIVHDIKCNIDAGSSDDDGFIEVVNKKRKKNKTLSSTNDSSGNSLYINKIDDKLINLESKSINSSLNTKPIAKNNEFKKYDNDLLNKLNTDENLIILEYLENKDDVFAYLCFDSICDDFYIKSFKDKQNLLREYKIDCVSIFNKENLFKECNFTSKECKKAEIDEYFIENKKIPLCMLKVIGSVLNLNIVYIENKQIPVYLNKFNSNNATILVYKLNNKYYTIKPKKGLIRGEFIKKLLNELKIGIENTISLKNKDSLDKMKLEELQNIANSLNIDIKKDGKTGKVNIKKEELIEIILKN